MSFLRRAAVPGTMLRPVLSTAPRARIQARYASQDYGSGAGNPAGEQPQKQGKNPSEELEHPGPPPPKVAQGKSPSPNEQSGSKPSSGSGSKSGSTSKQDGLSRGSSSKKGAPQPKILNEDPPDEKGEGVKEHNEEMDRRAEKAHERVTNTDAKKDKVNPKFWSGRSPRSVS